MCIHWRIVYLCRHSNFGDIFKRCEVEQKFDNGETDEGCSKMLSHGMATIRVEIECRDCAKDKTKIDTKLGAVKEAIKKLRENLDGRVDKPKPKPAPEPQPELELEPEFEPVFYSSDLESDDEDAMVKKALELMNKINVDSAQEPKPSVPDAGTDAALAPTPENIEATESEATENGTDENGVKEVRVDSKHHTLYLPILIKLPDGMKNMVLGR